MSWMALVSCLQACHQRSSHSTQIPYKMCHTCSFSPLAHHIASLTGHNMPSTNASLSPESLQCQSVPLGSPCCLQAQLQIHHHRREADQLAPKSPFGKALIGLHSPADILVVIKEASHGRVRLQENRALDGADVDDIVPGDDGAAHSGGGCPLQALHGQLRALSRAQPAHKCAAVLCACLVFAGEHKAQLGKPELLLVVPSPAQSTL